LHPGLIEAIINTLHAVPQYSFYVLLFFMQNKWHMQILVQ